MSSRGTIPSWIEEHNGIIIEIANGNIFESGTAALVNPVNCYGVMNVGLANEFYRRFSEHFDVYWEACRRNEVQPGRMLAVEIPWHRLPRYIINLPVRRNLNDESRIEDIKSELQHLASDKAACNTLASAT